MAKTQTSGPAFALAGKIVRTPEHARRILTDAVIKQQHWLIPQCAQCCCQVGKDSGRFRMSAHRLANWLLALSIVGIYVAMAFIDGPSDHSAEQAQAQSLADAQRTEAAAERFAKASATLCGNENATVRDLGDGSIQCLTKRGHKTIKVAL